MAHRHRLHHRHAQLGLQGRAVDADAAALRDVDHVQRQHHGHAEFAHFQREAQVQAQVGGIDHADDDVRRRLAGIEAAAEIAGDRLVQARGHQAVGARQVEHGIAAARGRQQPALLALDRDAGVVRHLLAAAGQLVEQRGLAAVGVADQGQAHERSGGPAHAATPPAGRSAAPAAGAAFAASPGDASRTRAASSRRSAKRV